MSRRDVALCDAAMACIRECLRQPPPQEAAWRGISSAHRIYLLMASGLRGDRHMEPWAAFAPAEQALIERQIHLGGVLARRWKTFTREKT